MKYQSCYHLSLGDKPLGVTNRVNFFFEVVKELIEMEAKECTLYMELHVVPCRHLAKVSASCVRGGHEISTLSASVSGTNHLELRVEWTFFLKW